MSCCEKKVIRSLPLYFSMIIITIIRRHRPNQMSMSVGTDGSFSICMQFTYTHKNDRLPQSEVIESECIDLRAVCEFLDLLRNILRINNIRWKLFFPIKFPIMYAKTVSFKMIHYMYRVNSMPLTAFYDKKDNKFIIHLVYKRRVFENALENQKIAIASASASASVLLLIVKPINKQSVRCFTHTQLLSCCLTCVRNDLRFIGLVDYAVPM